MAVTKKQRWISLAILIVLAIGSALMTGYVLEKAKPDNLAAFANRFTNQLELGWNVQQGPGWLETGDERHTRLSWETAKERVVFETAVLPAEVCKKLLVNATIGGPQNAYAAGRWNHRIWMELTALKDGAALSSSRIEVTLESDLDRGRIYAVETAAEGSSQYQVRLIIEPLNGVAEAGWLDVSKWEVYAK